MGNFIDKIQISGASYDVKDSSIDISQYWTSAQTSSAITEATSGKLDTSVFQTYSGGVDTALANKAETSAVTEVNNALTAHTANTQIHVTTAQTAAWDAKSDFSGDYNDLTNKPTIPTTTSAVTSGSTDVVESGAVYDQLGGMKILHLTQAQYDALSPNYDNTTLYVITNS